ncbi:aminomethyltransferase [Geobacter sp. OR-1]|uniref:glycine cleavage system aminomethyltransferase GcvT n=1 Tax=Geobacter sp. OR-1 TaxID=1266765 RepID=UPI0005426184|nr:glycine cleavage system aminomethyltransferase GcvT [Geobacter sp. OR-1]GAM09152.1 aminomethyltransferase [Geobacter sp. OR-1]
MAQLRETPLIQKHTELGALIAPFGGWNMPIQYEGIIAEHRWCRQKAALFDICHMGEFLYRGDIVSGGLDDVFTFSVAAIPVGRSKYGFLLNEQGGIIDDLIVFRLASDEAMIVVNAATAENDFKIISSRLKDPSLITDISAATGKLDIQGPLSRDILTSLFGSEIGTIPYFKFIKTDILGSEAIVSRTGYTGELGYEIFLPAAKVAELWNLIASDPGIKPAGLGARDLLRLEVGYSLYGNDLDETISPLEAGLEMFVNFDKDFVGKDALLRQKAAGGQRTRIAFRVGSRRSPRHHYEVWSGEEKAGTVTSGAFSPMLGCGIGLALADPKLAAIGTEITVRHENVSMAAVVCGLPFFDGGSLRN